MYQGIYSSIFDAIGWLIAEIRQKEKRTFSAWKLEVTKSFTLGQPVKQWPVYPVTGASELNENWYNKTHCFTLPCAKVLSKLVLI